jgi:hypothetical protein
MATIRGAPFASAVVSMTRMEHAAAIDRFGMRKEPPPRVIAATRMATKMARVAGSVARTTVSQLAEKGSGTGTHW